MEIYNEIKKKYFEKIEKIEKEKKSEKITQHIFFDTLYNEKKYSVKEKYVWLQTIMTNIFLTKENREEIFIIFSFIQKTYLALVRFKFLLLFKKSKKIVENDLSLNPILEKDKDVLVIFQNNNKYLFHIRDLLHLINNCLGNSSHFFSQPIIIKNPYNNVVFSKSTLYNIYFFMRFKTMHFSELFHQFFLCNFHLSDFYDKNNYLLRTYAIDDYFKNTCAEYLINDIDDMINEFNQKFKLNKIVVDPDFPDNKYLEILKPYLKLYLITQYSLLYLDKINAKKQLDKKLLNFHYFNPNFGRKIVKINYPLNKKFNKFNFIENEQDEKDEVTCNSNSKSRSRIETSFIDEHLPYHKNKRSEFLNSHSMLTKEDSEEEE